MRMRRAHGILALAVPAWCACAYLLARTSVPHLDLSGFDQHRYFLLRELRRDERFSRGEDGLWAAETVARFLALGMLAWRLPRSVRAIALGRISSAIVVGMVVLTTLWFVALPFGIANLWWQHHWGLGAFDVGAWLGSQWATLGSEAVFALAGIVLVVGLAGRLRHWWLVAAPVVVAVSAFFALVAGWASAAGTHQLRAGELRYDARRLERIERVDGTPVRVQDVSSWTTQANAFTSGFGPSTHVVLWNTLLDGRFTRAEVDVVVAHELGHVASRHIVKAIGWSGLIALPILWLLGVATRRRGGVGDAANLPLAVLVLAILAFLFTPLENAVSRRYEAEADWRALNAARAPAAQVALLRAFARTSLERPDPPLLGYLWLENHPTLMQRIAMAERWRQRER
jgi:STE24 endopeptidase